MPATLVAEVAPELLVWARKSAKLDLQQAAKKLGVSEDRLQELESGVNLPSFPQLRKMAEVYKRPLSVFLLSEPPIGFDAMHVPDFRMIAESEWADLSPQLVAELRWANERREVALAIAQERNEVPEPLPFKISTQEQPEEVAKRIRSLLAVTLEEQHAWASAHAALNRWRDAVEATGVLVFHTDRVKVEEMRGISISEEIFPMIIMNGSDFPRGRIFTLLHEFAHLLVRHSGVCDLLEGPHRSSQIGIVEVFCNRVAAAILMPRSALLQEPLLVTRSLPREWPDNEIHELASRYSVSDEAMLRRLVTVGAASEEFYVKKREEYVAIYAEQHKAGKQAGAAPPHFRMVLRRNGLAYTRLVLDAYYQRYITASDLSSYLNVKLKHIADIEREAYS